MNKAHSESLEATKAFLAKASDEEIKAVLAEVDGDYEGCTIDEYLAYAIEPSEFAEVNSQKIKGEIPKISYRKKLPIDVRFSAVNGKPIPKRERFRRYSDVVKAKKRGDSCPPLFFYICLFKLKKWQALKYIISQQ